MFTTVCFAVSGAVPVEPSDTYREASAAALGEPRAIDKHYSCASKC